MIAAQTLGELAEDDFANGRCSRRRWSGELLCSMPATVTQTGMCVHEHMYENGYCEIHAGHARAGIFACVLCRAGEQPHNCTITVVAETPFPEVSP